MPWGANGGEEGAAGLITDEVGITTMAAFEWIHGTFRADGGGRYKGAPFCFLRPDLRGNALTCSCTICSSLPPPSIQQWHKTVGQKGC